MEEACGRPMFHTEYRGINQVKYVTLFACHLREIQAKINHELTIYNVSNNKYAARQITNIPNLGCTTAESPIFNMMLFA